MGDYTLIITLGFTILGGLVGYFGFRRNQNNDIRTETKEDIRKQIEKGRGFEKRNK